MDREVRTRAIHRARRPQGFTLIEVMVVVAILGVIAGLAIPTFMQYVHRTRRSEALMALQMANDLQLVYFGKHGEYADDFLELGFDLDGGDLLPDGSYQGPYYTYTIETRKYGTNPKGNYRITATGDIDPSDPILDIIIIENDLTVVE